MPVKQARARPRRLRPCAERAPPYAGPADQTGQQARRRTDALAKPKGLAVTDNDRTDGTDRPQRPGSPLPSREPVPSAATERFIPPHGGYRKLLSYQKALVVYDATVQFCDRCFSRFDRTRDQMIQAARSGKQSH